MQPSLKEQWTGPGGHKAHSADSQNRIENAYKCLRILKETTDFTRVADFGCGIGGWLAAAQLLGATEIQGFEGQWIADAETVVPKDRIRISNLAEEVLDLKKRFDLAITIEVAEHLPEKAADGFVSTLASASDRILFSAAIPKQGGIGHINEQPLVYWITKFWQLRFVPLEMLRPYIAADRSIYPWLRQNLVMFVSYDLFIRSPKLHAFARPLTDFNFVYPCPN
jgi:hypothetical protein